MKCQSPCPKCENRGSCNKHTGVCDCQPGFTGKLCQNGEIKSNNFLFVGLFRPLIKTSLSQRIALVIKLLFLCHFQHFHLYQTHGLVKRRPINLVLGAECPPGVHGPGCSMRCSCPSDATCDPLTGRCICPPGKRGHDCATCKILLSKPDLNATRIKSPAATSVKLHSMRVWLLGPGVSQ